MSEWSQRNNIFDDSVQGAESLVIPGLSASATADPGIGHFAVLDPARDMRGDGDLWDYCVDDPINCVDPMGLAGERNQAEKSSSENPELTPKDERVPLAPLGNNIEDHIAYAARINAKIEDDSLFPKSVAQFTTLEDKLSWIKKNLGNKGIIDFKQEGSKYEDAGNFYFGAYAARLGIPEGIALRGAGYAQRKAGTSKEEWGTPYDVLRASTYGDDPKGQLQIRDGYRYGSSRK